MRISKMLLVILLLLDAYILIDSIPINNGVVGQPEIDCGGASITINFNTINDFEGKVYVKGMYNEGNCRRKAVGNRAVAGIKLPFDSCNVRKSRVLNPRGVFVYVTVVISFHPVFETKVDRAYRVQCYYMESEKTVTAGIQVSMLTTELYSFNVPMPVCRYEILDGSPAGRVLDFALVGQQVYHKWTCDTETIDTYCMVVHSCMVDDSQGDRVLLIGADGCATDRHLLNNPEYTSTTMGGVEAHVFKYADRALLYFQCQISIYVKESGLDCPRPRCRTPSGRGAGGGNPLEGDVEVQSDVLFPPPPGSPYLPPPRPMPHPNPFSYQQNSLGIIESMTT